MSASPTSLLPHLLHDPTVKPPYSNTQISESAMHQETIYIYRTARPETRVFYERGHYMEGDAEENWIIKWLLWHVFRYRDNRNRGRAMPAWIARPSQGPESPGSASGGPQTPQPLLGNTPPPYSAPQQLPPIHYAVQSQAPMRYSSEPRAHDQESEPRSQSQGYWDPVRDAQRSNRN
ncbi:hypothetical protein KVT40_005078 [Elsinoe batatas]|uniref:Uncharacterized protein n=1 Tax=Elsinoe batatas TaxID=2601811 RepID=A0A8K0L522_9PEZI|nr:hypothetical protein KVT40_005078 [Elsinoe batatas]